MIFLHFRLERVTNQAMEPPMAMPRMPAPVATMKEFFSGSQKLTSDHSLPSNSLTKCCVVKEPTFFRYRRFSRPRCTVNMLESMVIIGIRDSTTSTLRKNTSSKLEGLVKNARSR